MNGNSPGNLQYSYDSQTGLCIGTDLEEQFCEFLDATVEVKKVSAAQGFSAGYGYATTVEVCSKWFDLGNTLVHCTHGADRTGFVVAAWLKAQAEAGVEGYDKLPTHGRYGGATYGAAGGDATNEEALWDYATSFNSWKTTICRQADLGFAAYLDAFYPMKDFCTTTPVGAKESRETTCAACKREKYKAIWVVSPDLPAGEKQWEEWRKAGYWEYHPSGQKEEWRWVITKSAERAKKSKKARGG